MNCEDCEFRKWFNRQIQLIELKEKSKDRAERWAYNENEERKTKTVNIK